MQPLTFTSEDGPRSGRERIAWWRATKAQRGAQLAAMPKYRRYPIMDRLHHDKWMIRKSYDTFSRFTCQNFYISLDVMERAQDRRRRNGLPTPEDRRQHRHIIESLRMSRMGDGGPLARLERSIEGNPPFIYDLHSGYIYMEDDLMDAMNAGIEFEILTLRMTEGRALKIRDVETRTKHHGYWSFDTHEKDRFNREPGAEVRIEFFFSNPTDLLWFKFRYG